MRHNYNTSHNIHMGSRIKNTFLAMLPFLVGLFLYFQISSPEASLGHLHYYFPNISSLLFDGSSSSIGGLMGSTVSVVVLIFMLFLLPFISSYRLEAAMLLFVGLGFYIASTLF